MYVHTSFGTYSDRRVLDLQRCAGVIALCCAVLCCAGLCCAVLAVLVLNDNVLVHTIAELLLLYTGTA